MKKCIFFVFILYSIHSQSFSQDKAPILIHFEESECNSELDEELLQERIANQQLKSDTFMIEIGTIANCGGIRSQSIKYENDTLDIFYDEGQERTDTLRDERGKILEIRDVIVTSDCECCFEFIFYIKGISKIPSVVRLNKKIIKYYPDKYKVYPIKYDLINGDTVNYIDKYGLKQRYWNKLPYNENDENQQDSTYYWAFYVNDGVQKSEKKVFYKNGKLKHHYKRHDQYSEEQLNYNEKGELEKLHIRKNVINYTSFFYQENRLVKIEYRQGNTIEKTEFHKNGNLKSIKNNFVHKDFYENGSLQMEEIEVSAIHRKTIYYYPNGKKMATYEIIYDKITPFKNIWKYWDENGKPVSKDVLLKKGYQF